jgi:hypothetical protein
MPFLSPSLPKVSLRRAQWVRLIVVGFFAALAIARVAPDLVRVAVPLGDFDYATDGNGVVVRAGPGIRVGDRVRVDLIKPFDRKGGIVGSGYTYDNPNRVLPVERDGRVLRLHLKARPEKVAGRALTALRVLLFFAIVVLGGILFLVQPGIATAAIAVYCIANEGPSTWLALQIPNPWRQAFTWYADTWVGLGGAALLLFALCLLFESPRVQRVLAVVIAAAGLGAGTLYAAGDRLLTFAGHPAARIDAAYLQLADAFTWATIATFFAAYVRARGDERRRTGWIVAAFAFAAAARLGSEAFYPARLAPWENGVLLSASVLPILVVWVAVIRDRFFNVDFVVSRAVVYVALSMTVIGVITASEEIGTYVFIQNTDLAYGFLIVISMAVGSTTGKLREGIEALVDRFIFRDRLARQHALELIAGYILDAENQEDVERALLEDAAHALDLSFGGILVRGGDGAFRLGAKYNWPADCTVELAAEDELLKSICRTRGTMRFSGKESRLVKETFANERLTFAAPLFFDRSVNAIVVYGHSAIGLDLDPDEREGLIEVVAHASIALHAIELARLRARAAEARSTGSHSLPF